MTEPGKLDPAIRVVMMPRDTNPMGTIFGGIILSHIDVAGAVEARKHSEKMLASVAMHEVKFIAPVFVQVRETGSNSSALDKRPWSVL